MNFNKYKNIKKLTDLTSKKSEYSLYLKKLITNKKKSLGKSSGTIVSWHRGGGVKKNYRILYQNNNTLSSFGLLRSIEYDPNRSTYIGLIQLQDGSFCYTSLSSVMQLNDVIYFSKEDGLNLKVGDFLKLRYIPVGVSIFNIEKYPGSGPVYVKAAGASAKIVFKDVKYCKIKLSSGLERIFDLDCTANLGISSNSSHKFNKKYKAGTNRLLNKRPTVRGTVMNPIDHPHGGGQNKSTPGRPSVSPWGKLTKGVPTKNTKKNFYRKKI